MPNEDIMKKIEQVSATIGLDFNDKALSEKEKEQLYIYISQKIKEKTKDSKK